MLWRGRDKEQDKKERELLAKYYNILAQEETHLKQKARVDWLQKGDRNTKFFKMTTLKRRSFNRIIKTRKSNGITTYEEEEIQVKFISYFEKLLNSDEKPSNSDIEKILEVIPCPIDQDQKKELEKEVTHEEIKKVVYMMNDDKSPSPNGFLTGFFKNNWDIMGADMSEFVL